MAYQISSDPITTIGTTAGFIDLISIAAGSCVTLSGNVLCVSSTGLVRAWNVTRTGKRLVGGSPTLVGSAPAAVVESDASFAPAIALAVGGATGDLIRIQCTGVSGATIRWVAIVQATELSIT